ncbi:hypothetical protein [Massilia soli]|uniref:Uncharacterized protein n=1 Tax=Massilia soli TaxID=2792854 RepID=A0ABS7SPJ2_9BURK|nr:hypothetical protein [Massilia soli]MBZ2207045.1 hypothetical protein [Massilia soli]
MNKETDGLSTVEEVEALADQLSVIADELHQRIMDEIRQDRSKPPSATRQAALRALFDQELVLRQRANGLYADAASLVVSALGQPQRQLAELTTRAAEKIRKIALIKDISGLVASVLGLAGAVATGQPAPIILALEKIKNKVEALDAHQVKKSA